MEPIATYREKRFDGERTFELYADRVAVRGKVTLASDFDASVPLITLTGNITRLRLRNRGFFSGMWMAVLPAILASIINKLYQGDTLEVTGFLILLSVCGLLLMAVTAKKVEFASFQSTSGGVGLDVARAGQDVENFDAFVNAVAQQIAAAKNPPAAEKPPSA